MPKGLKRRASSQPEDTYRIPNKQRGVDSDSDTISVDSEDSRNSQGKKKLFRRKDSSESKPSLRNKQSSLGGVVSAFLELRSRSIVREAIPEEEPAPPPPRKLLSAKRRIFKKSSTLSEFGPIAAPSLSKKFSENRAATAIF